MIGLCPFLSSTQSRKTNDATKHSTIRVGLQPLRKWILFTCVARRDAHDA